MIRETWLSTLKVALLACELAAETEEEKALMGVLDTALETIIRSVGDGEHGSG